MLMGKRAECSVYVQPRIPSVVVLLDDSNGRLCRRGNPVNTSHRSDTSLVSQPYYVPVANHGLQHLQILTLGPYIG
jgi:hypothetical protein